MKLLVWILKHDWEDDSSLSVHGSEQAAKNDIRQYVEENWDNDLMDGNNFPVDDPDFAVQLYFEATEDYEWYSITNSLVDFPDLPEVPNQDVVLTSDECAIAVKAIGQITYKEAAEELGITAQEAVQIVDSAYNKLKD